MADQEEQDGQEHEGEGGESSGSSSSQYGKDVEGIVRKYGGNPRAAIRVLLDEAKKNRDRIKALSEGKEVNLDGPALPDGAVVLPAEDAKAWEAFKALGQTPKEIRAALKKAGEDAEARQQLETRIAEDERGQLAERAAESLGWNAKLFRKIAKLEGVHVTEVDENGEKAYKARGLQETDDALVPLSEYADTHLQDYPFEATGRQQNGNGNGKSHGATHVAPYPHQSPEGTAPRGLSDEELLQRKRRMMAGRGIL